MPRDAALSRTGPPVDRAPAILGRLRRAHPDARIALAFSNPFECLVATILSAQSTDAKVNEVTARLWRKYRAPADFLGVPEEELQDDIRPTGFFRQKTRALRAMSQKLLDDHDGEVPHTMEELVGLPGVARKTANVVQGACFPSDMKKDPDAGIAVDTHVGRVAVRLGLTERSSKEAVEIEQELMAVIPRKDWIGATHLFIEHGRKTCDARRPRCEDCVVENLCPSSQEAGLVDLFRRTASPPKAR